MSNTRLSTVTIVAGGLLLAALAAPGLAQAEDATKPNYKYQPQNAGPNGNDYHANYHADYSANRTPDTAADNRSDRRDGDSRRDPPTDPRFPNGPYSRPGWGWRH
jgi:hypothetical protein